MQIDSVGTQTCTFATEDLPAKNVSNTAFSSVDSSLLCNKTPEEGKSSEKRKKKVFKVRTKKHVLLHVKGLALHIVQIYFSWLQEKEIITRVSHPALIISPQIRIRVIDATVFEVICYLSHSRTGQYANREMCLCSQLDECGCNEPRFRVEMYFYLQCFR